MKSTSKNTMWISKILNRDMSKSKPGKKAGKTDWEKLRARRKSAQTPSAEERTEAAKMWSNADFVVPDGKTRMTVRFDSDVVEWFKSYGPRYQTRMNAVLRQFMAKQQQSTGDASLSVREEPDVYSVPGELSQAEYMKALNELGKVRTQQGDLDAAAKCHEQARDFFQRGLRAKSL
jgi:uncharacterized protein (DUF4415 family)